MLNILHDCLEWAQMEFAAAKLGDARRTKRLVKVAGALAKGSKGVLTESLDSWAELKAGYRLFSNEHVTHQSVLTPHFQRTLQSCCQPGEYLLIEDGSDLDFSGHRLTRGLGRTGNDGGYGMLLHTNLAARVHHWQLDHTPQVSLMGLLDQQCWVRTHPSRRKQKERWRKRMERARESQYWAAALSRLPKDKPAGVQWIYVADRESDIYEAFERALQQQCECIIRAQHARALADEDQTAFAAVGQAPVLGRFDLELRTRPGVAARVAKLEVRSRAVTIRGVERPGGRRPDLKLNMVEVREIEPPAHVEPIHWILFTTLPVETFEQARRVASRYAQRWLIEEYHKALKTGVQMEKSQLETAKGLQALLGVLAVVAARLLNTRLLAHLTPHEPIEAHTLSPEALAILNARFEQPKEGWTYQSLIIALARLGGFVGRKSDGLPGWITLWRGMQRLTTMVAGVLALAGARTVRKAKTCG